jgi:asparagine synthase (glutamine-hydrolysing)
VCGIYGRWNLDGRPVDAGQVRRATTALRHRGPDDEGYLLTDSRTGVYRHCGGDDTDPRISVPPVVAVAGPEHDLALGFRRLSILDLSPAGHQPMASPDGGVWIVYNGEVYNYRELRDELRAAGHVFRGGSDTEVVLAAYREWGPACLHRFNGMWALAVWDARARTLLLARDRFGVKPLFYTQGDGAFAFASEVKALVGAHGVPFRPDAAAVVAFAARGSLPSPTAGDTFFAGIRALPAGHVARVTHAGVSVARFYTPPTEADGAERAPAEAAEGYRELLKDAVRLRLRADVPVGSCLSGGLDSSSIVCLVNRMLQDGGTPPTSIGDRQKAFSAVYETEGPYNERVHIDRVLAATGAEANFTYPTADRLLEAAERMVWHQDEPFGSTSIFAQWCVMEAVRARGVTVLLDGQGADEALAGYRPFDVHVGELLRGGRLGAAAAALRGIHAVAGVSPGRLLAVAAANQLRGMTLADAPRRLRTRRQRTLLRPETAYALQPPPRPATGGGLQAYLLDALTETSLPHLLRYEDRNSMAFSVEARVPFVDYRLVEFSLTATAGLRIRDGWTKWILRRAMRGVVPDEIVWRRDKVGFETPERPWVLRLVSVWPEVFADGARVGEFLDLPAVRGRVDAWTRGAGDTRAVWRWMNLEKWLDVWSRA